MSLVGNLEDLGLGDVLQIVSLSRKSGVLSLKSSGREGRIVFQNGQVIQATSTVSRDNLGDLLVRKGLVDVPTLKKALLLQARTRPMPRIGAVLANNFGLSQETIDRIIGERIESIVYSFFGWNEGTFSFELCEAEELAATRLNPLQFMLDQGLNPQWLAMEGSRILDEARQYPGGLGEPEEEPPPNPSFSIDEPMAESLATAPASNVDLGAELLHEIGETEPSTREARKVPTTGIHLLKGMLQELSNPSVGGGIILLVLRFAAEFMNRAVVFLRKEGHIIGLGQFGIEGAGALVDARIRRMKIPEDGESIFRSVLQQKTPMVVHPGNEPWDSYLWEQLGGEVPEEVFLGPIVSEGEVVAVLYGDNLPSEDPIDQVEPLEIFLSQAGLAMEKALLERRLSGKVSA